MQTLTTHCDVRLLGLMPQVGALFTLVPICSMAPHVVGPKLNFWSGKKGCCVVEPHKIIVL